MMCRILEVLKTSKERVEHTAVLSYLTKHNIKLRDENASKLLEFPQGELGQLSFGTSHHLNRACFMKVAVAYAPRCNEYVATSFNNRQCAAKMHKLT